ncbi:MAG: DEAD/DEAH box helicase [Gammaproteobacteria bacterium]|jgi:ATP-dependent RNA helicase DeaD|nr:DEAD/DEAH box helicase [Gammaproteobacteria bacterium]MBT4586793.1 DEAD/DEAH box helicase [Gammaproteobacteria bacterium]MBT5978437.1 DEAD/DEAH box helicase [Gammaproteobacteria bacterium]MBT6141861.1 DEAD/DEAH box helicase [Gammaproteobacteria bacterium]MBT8009646.1 DEAD/DEAH box helicase [Gammaproteobacteria bacterium]
MSEHESSVNFKSFGLSEALIKVLDEVGYETPSAIQEQCIPHLLNGHDVIGQAQTGTGKTAAFSLPLIDRIDINTNQVQLLVLTPTRELAIQVSEAIQTYARHFKGLHVLPIYGGQSYDIQLRPLKRGVHVVVGTPGRVMDHIKKGTLKLGSLKALVLDEADEMLRMGFIDDVKWVMEKLPKERQIALFSATMPDVIRRVAEKFLNVPKIVKIKTKTATAQTISQRYWLVSGVNKLDALTRILEVETFDALLIFVRTKTATVDLAEKLSARGFSSEAINGDIAQNQRERTIQQLKKGKIDILIATDVAARGLDVERISHVVNYDIPQDPESYVHRIGRTGRAGREGKAILFVAPRERRMLQTIERITRQPITPMQLPSAKIINEQRVTNFKQRISDTLNNQELGIFEELILSFQKEHEVDAFKIASALALMAQGTEPLLLSEKELSQGSFKEGSKAKISISVHADPLKNNPSIKMRRYRLAVGHKDNIKPGNVLGAIANEAEISSEFIGAIQIFQDFTTIDLPDEMTKETLAILKKTRVFDKKLNIEELSEKNNTTSPHQKSDDFKRNSSRRGGERKFERKPRGKGGDRPNRHKDKKFSRGKPKRKD